MSMDSIAGRPLALRALRGEATERVPVGLITWGFDYYWKTAGLEPWQMACGSSAMWHQAYLDLLDRHGFDILWYGGAGNGPEEPTLLEEDNRRWVARDNNNGVVYAITKDSYTRYELASGHRSCDPVGVMESREDVDRLIKPELPSETYLEGLARLIREVGDRTLVLPHVAEPYIMAAYDFGFEPAMHAMLSEPELFVYACEKYRVRDIARMRLLKDAGAEVVYIADGWASCDIISPAMFARFALPYQRTCAEAGRDAGLLTILWNEGDVLPVLDLEASLPIDAFAFEQPRKGADLTVARVREVFGPRRCLFGNLDSEQLLMRNDPEEIAAATRAQMQQSGEGAPFVLSTGSPLPSNIELSAVDTIMETARAFRF
ncbi:MAG: uroporphyrinogen decarboxylase family protein [Anaerolineae bacterium]